MIDVDFVKFAPDMCVFEYLGRSLTSNRVVIFGEITTHITTHPTSGNMLSFFTHVRFYVVSNLGRFSRV